MNTQMRTVTQPGKMPRHRCYIIGVGMTPFVHPDSTYDDYPQMVEKAVKMALEDAGLAYHDIDQAYAGYVFGDSTCGQRALYDIGMTGIPICNVNNNCSTGSTALYLAKQVIEGGISKCVLAVGFEKMVKGPIQLQYSDRANPLENHLQVLADTYDLTASPIAAQMFGAAGREHMEKYGTKPEHFAKIALKNHSHAQNNPYAQAKRGTVTLEDIVNSPLLSQPLTRLQCCPVSNGAAAAILASEDFVHKHNLEKQAVEIIGMELGTDLPSTFKEKSCIKMVGFDMTRKAAEKLYQNTGISPKEVNVIELHDCFSTNELLTYEALGLCEIGKGAEMVEHGNNTYGGKYVVNPSGGLIAKGHPLGATGVAQCAELCWHLRNKAGARQVPNAKTALQHNIGVGGAVVVALYRLGFPPEKNHSETSQAFEARDGDESGPVESEFKSDTVFQGIKEALEAGEQLFDKNINGIAAFKITSESGKEKTWAFIFENGNCRVSSDPNIKADATLKMKDSLVVDIFAGKRSFQAAFLSRQFQIKGSLGLLMKLMPVANLMSKL
uniref:Sterol carrier protein 2 n=1 Tax=Hadrurus spadix TaxID=141984 RepID=A0A1W7RA84_9SCOR